ncbi:MAG: hypothetical protein JW893_06150 [Candidatus Omnitrophica bacterium]|nr:hypothetical protein [Candidatus Omnitrophota bacterium]
MRLYLEKQKRFLRKILLGMGLFLTGFIALSFLYFISNRWIPLSWTANLIFQTFLMTFLCLAAYKPLDLGITKLFRHYLFKKKSYGQIMLIDLAEELAVILDLKEWANLVVNTFGEVFHLRTVALLVPGRDQGGFEVASAYGWSVSDVKKSKLSQNSILLELMRRRGSHVLVRDGEIQKVSWQEANHIAQEFDFLHATWVIPLTNERDLIGAIAFSASTPDVVYHEGDFQFFREFARAIGKSLHNALRFSELRAAYDELQDVQSHSLQRAKLSAIERLATGLAHEIHNPLTVISGKAQVLLLKKGKDILDEQVEEVLRTIVKQTKRAADITRKLLMFSQSSGAPREQLHLEQVLEDTVSLISYQTSLEEIEISRAIGNRMPAFYGNVHELREVFLNLILNAVQSIGSRGKIHCNLRYRSKEQVFEITIADSGPGISEENIDKLFNPFFTTRPDGVGLGLFVTRQIVHRYGGSIRVESQAGQGSVFIVQFPHQDHDDKAVQGEEFRGKGSLWSPLTATSLKDQKKD